MRRVEPLSGGRVALSAVALCCAALLAGMMLMTQPASGKGNGANKFVAIMNGGDQSSILNAGSISVQVRKGKGEVFVQALSGSTILGRVTDPREVGKGGTLLLPLSNQGRTLLSGCSADQLRSVHRSKTPKRGKIRTRITTYLVPLDRNLPICSPT